MSLVKIIRYVTCRQSSDMCRFLNEFCKGVIILVVTLKNNEHKVHVDLDLEM